MKQTYKLRKTFWSPYDEMKEHIGKKFTLLRSLTKEEIGDPECEGEMFKIRLEDGEEITAWFEEIYDKSCMVNGELI